MNSGNKGLANLGNTCYMNTALQCLSHLLEFHPQNRLFNKTTGNGLYNEWYEFQSQMWSDGNETMIVPRKLLQSFIKTCKQQDICFFNFHQNDTEEFINIFMDLLHRSIKTKADISIEGKPNNQLQKLHVESVKSWSTFFKNDYSYIIQKFYSQLISITSCPKCDYYTVNFEPFMVLSLEIPDQSNSIYDCLDSYTKKHSLDLQNTWTCDKCKQQVQPEKKLKLWKTSNVLIILLKRYSKNRKKDDFVSYPTDLDLHTYSVDVNSLGKQYYLSGIGIQSGSLRGGHYYAMCRNDLDGQWREYNDTNVRTVEESHMLKQKPYCLFYRRK